MTPIITVSIDEIRPPANASLDQWRLHGRRCGRSYFRQWLTLKAEDWKQNKLDNTSLDNSGTYDHFMEVFLPPLNEQMRTELLPTDHELNEFNLAAHREQVSRLIAFEKDMRECADAGRLTHELLRKLVKRAMKLAAA